MLLFGQEPTVSYNSVKFGCHKHSGGRNIMLLVCHVVSIDRVIKEPCDFIDGSPSWYVTTLPDLVSMRIVVVEI